MGSHLLREITVPLIFSCGKMVKCMWNKKRRRMNRMEPRCWFWDDGNVNQMQIYSYRWLMERKAGVYIKMSWTWKDFNSSHSISCWVNIQIISIFPFRYSFWNAKQMSKRDSSCHLNFIMEFSFWFLIIILCDIVYIFI